MEHLNQSDEDSEGILHLFSEDPRLYSITCSGTSTGDPSYVFDHNNTNFWQSNGTFDGSFISIAFTKHKIKLYSYSFLSFPYECENHSHPIQWKVYGVTDKGIKKEIDYVEHNPAWAKSKVAIRVINLKEYFNNFTFTLIGHNNLDDDDYTFSIGAIDFFGIIESIGFQNFHSCIQTMNINFLFLITFTTIYLS